MYSLQVASISEQQALRQLWIDSFQQAYEDVHSAENIEIYCSKNFTLEAAKDTLTDETTICTLATRNDQKVGLCVVKHQNCPIEIGEDASELKQLYILASEYGTGLGKLLLQDAFEIARSVGRSWMWLCVSGLNYRAQAFYRKFGFSEIGDGPTLHVGSDRLPSLIMSLKL